MKQLLAYIVLTPFYLAWLAFCLLLAGVGMVLPKKRFQIDQEEVERVTTVCKVLNEKGLISDSEYEFETRKVASHYDRFTFQGYLFIMGPIIYLLKMTHTFDDFLLFLVKKWMLVHEYFFDQAQKPWVLYVGLTHFCVTVAQFVGLTLFYAHKMIRLKVEL